MERISPVKASAREKNSTRFFCGRASFCDLPFSDSLLVLCSFGDSLLALPFSRLSFGGSLLDTKSPCAVDFDRRGLSFYKGIFAFLPPIKKGGKNGQK